MGSMLQAAFCHVVTRAASCDNSHVMSLVAHHHVTCLSVQAVIFLFEHDDTASAGFILNRPTERLLGKLVGADELCPEFADNTVYLGGDVGDDTMHFLHGCSDIQVSYAGTHPSPVTYPVTYCHNS